MFQYFPSSQVSFEMPKPPSHDTFKEKISGLSLADTLKVVEMLEKGQSQASVVLSLGLSKSQVSRIKKASLELRKI